MKNEISDGSNSFQLNGIAFTLGEPIDAIGGEHTLTIIIVDTEGQENKITKPIYIPTLSVVTDKENFIINASDVGKITKVIIKFYSGNGVEQSVVISFKLAYLGCALKHSSVAP